MILQPSIDGRAETRHPVRVPRFGPVQRRCLRALALSTEPVHVSRFTRSERIALERLRERGAICRLSGRWYTLSTKEID